MLRLGESLDWKPFVVWNATCGGDRLCCIGGLPVTDGLLVCSFVFHQVVLTLYIVDVCLEFKATSGTLCL